MNLPFVREIPRHIAPEAPAGRPTRGLPTLRVLAPITAATALLVALPLGAACSCDPPDRPTMESCTDPSTDWSGVTGMTLTGAQYVNGIQGGSHFEFEIVATGTSVPTCFAYEGTLGSPGGLDSSVAGVIRASSDGAGTTTSRTIYYFSPPFETSRAFELEVTALGRTATASSGVDAGTSGDVGP